VTKSTLWNQTIEVNIDNMFIM